MQKAREKTDISTVYVATTHYVATASRGGCRKYLFVSASDADCFQSGLIKSLKQLCSQINAFVHTDLIYIVRKTLNNGHTNAKQINFSKARANTTVMFRQHRTKPLKIQH